MAATYVGNIASILFVGYLIYASIVGIVWVFKDAKARGIPVLIPCLLLASGPILLLIFWPWLRVRLSSQDRTPVSTPRKPSLG